MQAIVTVVVETCGLRRRIETDRMVMYKYCRKGSNTTKPFDSKAAATPSRALREAAPKKYEKAK